MEISDEGEMQENEDVFLGDIIKHKPEITYNNNRTYSNGTKAPDGIEIRFGSVRPTAEVREMLKAHGFQFSEKQTMWYARDNAKSRELAEFLSQNEVDVDNTQYEKRNFWVLVRSTNEFDKLRERTEFAIKTEPPKYFYSKSFLKKAFPSIHSLINEQALSYKRYYNKIVGEDDPESPKDEQSSSGNSSGIEIAEKLQALAEGMQKQIDAKINSATSRQRPTKKRMRVAAGMRDEGYKLQEIQTDLYALAQSHKTSEINKYPYLQKIRNRSQVELITRYEISKDSFDRYKEDLSKLGISSAEDWRIAREQKTKLAESYSPSSIKKQTENERKIKELEMQVLGAKIPGFFPSPPDLIEKLLELADIQDYDRVLEPSAGKGDILDAIKKEHTYKELHAIEPSSQLREILSRKGHWLVGDDFLEYHPEEKYDKIIMNPPFEDGQDIDHVRHAFSLLKPSGRLVAIMGEGAFFRQFKKDKAFREFLQEKSALVSPPIKEAFKNAFNSTAITVRIVAINADGSQVTVSKTLPENDADSSDSELLELEAEAELELLKMRVEMQRKKKKQLQGLGESPIDESKLQRFRQKAWAVQRRLEVLNYK